MIQDTNGKTYATAAEWMAMVRKLAARRDEHKSPPKDVQPREVPM